MPARIKAMPPSRSKRRELHAARRVPVVTCVAAGISDLIGLKGARRFSGVVGRLVKRSARTMIAANILGVNYFRRRFGCGARANPLKGGRKAVRANRPLVFSYRRPRPFPSKCRWFLQILEIQTTSSMPHIKLPDVVPGILGPKCPSVRPRQ